MRGSRVRLFSVIGLSSTTGSLLGVLALLLAGGCGGGSSTKPDESDAGGGGVCTGKPDGTVCDDGNACTQGDVCTTGVCRPGSPMVCPAADLCHTAPTCNPATGACTSQAKPDGTLCEDGDACTQVDMCVAGSCVSGTPKVCTALDQCHVAGTCDPKSGACSDPPKANGSVCNDGSACTQADSCQAGLCVGGNPTVCTALDQCHAVGICDPKTGACSQPLAVNGTVCDDGNGCTLTDVCQAGTCVGGNPNPCAPVDACHLAGVCDPRSGVCTSPVGPDGTACSDGDACTQIDTCKGGVCTGEDPKTCVALDQCHGAGTCDPTSGVCSNPAKPDGSSCNDGNGCTKPDTCVQGTCASGAAVVCAQLDACHAAGTCDPATGQCSNPEISCDDKDPCTTDGCDPQACKPGECGTKNGCGHVLTYGAGCSKTEPAPEVTITNAAIATTTATVKAGETVPVTFALQATAEQADFSVEFVLFPAELSSTDAEVQGESLGGTRLATVPAGASEHTIRLALPPDVPGGLYQLYAHKYSDSEGVFWEGTALYTVEATPVLPTFDLSGYEPGSVSMFIDQASTVDPNAPTSYRPLDHSGTLALVSRSQDATQVPVRAYVTMPDGSGKRLPLQIWDFKNKVYVSTLLVNDLKVDQPQDVLLDLAPSETVAAQLRTVVPEQKAVSADILITVNETATIPEGPCNSVTQDECRHQLGTKATLFLPPAGTGTLHDLPGESLNYQFAWKKSGGNKYFSAGIQFSAQTQLSAEGFSASVEGSLPVSVLGQSVDAIRARFEAAAPLDTPATASGDIGVVCTSSGCLYSFLKFDVAGEYSDTKEYEIVKGSARIVVVVVPITFEAGITAEITYGVSIGATAGSGSFAALTVTPSLEPKVKGWVSGGVGVTGLSGGVQGTLTLFGASLKAPISGEALLARHPNGNIVTGKLRETMTVSGEMLSGSVGLYAEYPTIKWCKVWRVKFPCGIRINRSTLDLCSWPGIQLGPWTLYDQQQTAFTINRCKPSTCGTSCETSGDDGCGGTLTCGACAAGQKCTDHTCGPDPSIDAGVRDTGDIIPDASPDLGPDADMSSLAVLCRSTGGQVVSQNCCGSASPFPTNCNGVIGACGCGPSGSRPMNVCSCPSGKCFSTSEGCTTNGAW